MKRWGGDSHVGFIAEEIPDLDAAEYRKVVTAIDLIAILTRVIQKQQGEIEE